MSYEQAMDIFKSRYAAHSSETWEDAAKRVSNAVCSRYVSKDTLSEIENIIATQKFIPAGRYLANAGKTKMFTNCLAMTVGDSKEGWATALYKASLALMKQCGVGIDVSQVRSRGSILHTSGGYASGAVSILHMINEVASHIKAGGLRRVALAGSMHWKQSDMEEFLSVKRLTEEQKRLREADYEYRTPLDNMNISVRLDDEFIEKLNAGDTYATALYNVAIEDMLEYGEPGFSINTGIYSDDIYVNPCFEYRSNKPDSVCNLGSIVLPRIKDMKELRRVIELAIMFLICGREEGDIPYDGIVKDNIGLGVTGVHTWLVQKGYNYSVPTELKQWLSEYRHTSKIMAKAFSRELGVPVPTRLRSIQPTGTTSLLAGLTGTNITSGIEPTFAKAYIRKWYKGDTPTDEIYIDELASEYGDIEDSFSIPIEQRLEVLSAIQEFVDMAISVTLNVPADSNEPENVARIAGIVKPYLSRLRGLTIYRDGSRGLSPLTPIPFKQALQQKHSTSSEYAECASGICGL